MFKPSLVGKNKYFDNHELVLFFNDHRNGLKGIIAIHSTILGPAIGGTRYYPYSSEEAALEDVLRLSKGMTYKCAISKIKYGGGKAVIIADKKIKKSKKYLASYARFVNMLNGMFFTGEDVGMTMKDIRTLLLHSSFFIGKPEKAGDPSPWAALGVFNAMEEAFSVLYQGKNFKGAIVAIKGLGKVGMELARLLYQEGAVLIGADIDEKRTKEFLKNFPGSKVVTSDTIHKQKVDIYAPCALGKEFNPKTIKELKCRIVCGAANNQLVNSGDGELLYRRRILYIPDYLANAGGLINVVSDLETKKVSDQEMRKRIGVIKEVVNDILTQQKKTHQPTNQISDIMAENFIKKAKSKIHEVHRKNS